MSILTNPVLQSVAVNTTLTAVSGKNYLIHNSDSGSIVITYGSDTATLNSGDMANFFYDGSIWYKTIDGADISNLAGTGRTTETVKNNADSIAANTDSIAANTDRIVAIEGFANTFTHAVSTAGVSVPSATPTVMIFNKVINDIGSHYNTTTGVYTVGTGEGGIYAVSVACDLDSGAWAINNSYRFFVYVNGTQQAQIGVVTVQLAETFILRNHASCSGLQFADGDQVTIVLSHDSSTTKTTRGTQLSAWVRIIRIA